MTNILFSMEAYVVSSSVVSSAKRKRRNHPPERIENAVNLARHIGATAAIAQLNKELGDEDKLLVGTVDSWLSKFKKEGKFWESGRKRGRPAIMDSSAGLREEWARQVHSFRSQGASVSGRTSMTIAQAVLEEKVPSLLASHGGSVKLSVRTGQNILKGAGMSNRKKTTTRVLPPEADIADARDKFFASLRDCFDGEEIDKHLLLNYDQTFHRYNPSRGFTWEKKGADRVQLLDSKDGFTLLPVISPAGVVGAQLIFDGTTTASLPRIAPGPLLKYTQTVNHWSNEKTTIDLFNQIIWPHIAARRAALGNPSAPAIILADAFPAHWTPAVQQLVNQQSQVAYIAVPECLTHIFQPLDLGVIAAIKSSVLKRKDEFMQSEVRQAVRENRLVLLSKSRPVLRDRVTAYIKECLSDPVVCAAHCCEVGFRRAGVLRALYGDEASIDVDMYVTRLACVECGENAFKCDSPPLCACFNEDAEVTLCEGCTDNHNTICERR